MNHEHSVIKGLHWISMVPLQNDLSKWKSCNGNNKYKMEQASKLNGNISNGLPLSQRGKTPYLLNEPLFNDKSILVGNMICSQREEILT